MYKSLKLAVVMPAYNEEGLIEKALDLPKFVDYIIAINDGSSDSTHKIMNQARKKDSRVLIVNNQQNLGLGASMVRGYKRGLETDADLFAIMPGDAQCDPIYLPEMIDELLSTNADYVKSNRFFHIEQLKNMPRYRRVGNIFITLLTKFATGYYSIFDTQNSFGIIRRPVVEKMPLHLIGKRYEFENTQLIAMSIINTKIKDYAVPAYYGKEKSSIKLIPTATRVLKSLFVGFWKRIYYKYILYSFHPIALFLLSGLVLFVVGAVLGIFLLYERVFNQLSPSSGTVMLAVLPLFLGFQLLLTAIIMDMNNEEKV